jgi:hypothetical protein
MSNINENRLNFVFTAADITLMNTSANAILAKMPANSSLSEDQRDSYNAISVENKVFCEECLSEAQSTGTGIVSSYINLPNLANDLTLNSQMASLEGTLSNLLQRIRDIRRVTGHEGYKASNAIYGDYGRAAEAGIDNAKSGYDRLKVRYEAQGNGGREADTVLL